METNNANTFASRLVRSRAHPGNFSDRNGRAPTKVTGKRGKTNHSALGWKRRLAAFLKARENDDA